MRRLIPLLVLGLCALVLPAHTQAVTYQGPITITAGGTYSGNYQSLDPNTPAVSIRTTAPVILDGANIQSEGTLIDINESGANVTIRNTNGYALNPGISGQSPGRFIDAEGIANLTVEHNYFEGTGGIYVLQPAAGATISIRYNSVKNISGRQSTGSGWTTSDVDPALVQFVQFDKVTGSTAEIAWNQVINDPYVSRPEDVINMYASKGTAGNPILIHDNYIRGSYPGNPDSDQFSGGGIIADGSATEYLKVYNNQVIETVNYGIAIAGGSNNEYYGNTVMGTGLLPDGNRAVAQNVGAYVNGSGTGNTVHDNTWGWYSADGSRNNAWFPNCPSGSCSYNNTSLPSPVTLSQEDAQFTVWQNKLSQNSVTVGPSTGSGTDTTPPSVPAGVSATALSSTQISVSWSASTDAVGTTGYKVFRNGVQAGSTADTMYTDASLSPSTSYSYTVAAYDAAGNTSAQSAAVSVSTQAAPAPTATLSANPTALTAGQSSILTWSSTNANSCLGTNFTASGTSGTASVAPSATTTYTVTCTGAGGTASASAVVGVTAPAPTPTPTPTPTPSPSPTPTPTPAPSPSPTPTSPSPSPSPTPTPTPSPAPAPSATLSANPQSVTLGQSSVLTWSSANAASCIGTNFLASGTSGSVTVTPAQTTVYGIDCSGATASATVRVTASSSEFAIGSRVITVANLNVRSQPTTSGKKLCTQHSGAQGTIVDGPMSAQGYTWWKVDFDTRCDGWVAGSFLAPASAGITAAADQTQSSLSDSSSQHFSHTLGRGWSGAEVRMLQDLLNRLGYFSETSTGYFGPITESAVARFQRDHDLEPVGFVGPRTRGLLNDDSDNSGTHDSQHEQGTGDQ